MWRAVEAGGPGLIGWLTQTLYLGVCHLGPTARETS
jgi:hypothetical protein